jgi:hypothetical protein
MRPPARSMWRVALPVFLLLTLPACLLIVSTSPTAVSGATIVFVAIDDGGLLVASLAVSVSDVDGHWQNQGVTARDGSFRCIVAEGITRVRAGVTLPSGFVLAGTDPWPREIDIPTSGDVEIQIHVKSDSGP